MKKYLFMLLASVTVLVSSCSPFQINTDYAKTANFNNYKTYKLRIDDLKLNDIDKDRVLNELSKQLQMKGLKVGDNPDLIVNVKAAHVLVNDINTGGPYGFGMYGGYYGWGMGMSYNWGYDDQYNSGSLTVDIIDASTQKLVWQGIGRGISVDSGRAKQRQIPEIIGDIMANYPPKQN